MIPSIVNGVLWGIAILLLQLNSNKLGAGTGFTLSQLGILISTPLGILWLHETRSRKELRWTIIGVALVIVGAVLAGVPFVDALSTILDPSLPLTVGEWEEWGNPLTSRAVFDAMSRYTPYENVPDGALLPAIMATTSVNDTRVEFVEPTKWVQILRERSSNDPIARPILEQIEMAAGHGGEPGRQGRGASRGPDPHRACSVS